jgi:hypothetical protein
MVTVKKAEIFIKKDILLCPVPGIGPTYARYYEGHASHPTYY